MSPYNRTNIKKNLFVQEVLNPLVTVFLFYSSGTVVLCPRTDVDYRAT